MLHALQKSGYDKPRIQDLRMIFKDKSKYERIYKVDANIHADDKTIEDMVKKNMFFLVKPFYILLCIQDICGFFLSILSFLFTI